MIVPERMIGEVGYLMGICSRCDQRMAAHDLDGMQIMPMQWVVMGDCPTAEQVERRLPGLRTAEDFADLPARFPVEYEHAKNERWREERPWLNVASTLTSGDCGR